MRGDLFMTGCKVSGLLFEAKETKGDKIMITIAHRPDRNDKDTTTFINIFFKKNKVSENYLNLPRNIIVDVECAVGYNQENENFPFNFNGFQMTVPTIDYNLKKLTDPEAVSASTPRNTGNSASTPEDQATQDPWS